MNVLDNRDVILVGVGNVFILIVWRDISAQSSGGVGAPRGGALVTGAISVGWLSATQDFPNDLRFLLGLGLSVAGRYGQNMV